MVWLLIPLGFALTVYPKPLAEITGELDAPASFFGSTFRFYQVLGLFIVLSAFLWGMGSLQGILAWLLGPLLPNR